MLLHKIYGWQYQVLEIWKSAIRFVKKILLLNGQGLAHEIRFITTVVGFCTGNLLTGSMEQGMILLLAGKGVENLVFRGGLQKNWKT
jgi:hypothetical protein